MKDSKLEIIERKLKAANQKVLDDTQDLRFQLSEAREDIEMKVSENKELRKQLDSIVLVQEHSEKKLSSVCDKDRCNRRYLPLESSSMSCRPSKERATPRTRRRSLK